MHIIRDYKSSNPRVNAELVLFVYVYVAHTHEPDLIGLACCPSKATNNGTICHPIKWDRKERETQFFISKSSL